MREQYPRFQALECEILNTGPDAADKYREYWAEHRIPFPGLADPDHRVAKRYDQAFRLLKLGRMPLSLVIDREGVIRERHAGESMSDIPRAEAVLDVLAKLRG